MKNIERLALVAVLTIAIFFRLYQLANVPPSPSVDEVSTGYNAYSILKTGKDEYGIPFPLVLRSYDDWQPALYTYLILPFVYFFDLTVFAVRFPSVILSMLSVIAVFLIMKMLFSTQVKEAQWFNVKFFALLVTFFFAISPLHIYVSRLGLPTNTGFSFFLFAPLFFLRKNMYLSAIFFSLSFMSYHADKIFIPIFVLGLAIVYRHDLLKQKRKVIIASILGFILILPFLKTSFSSSSLVRFKATSTLTLSAHWEDNVQRERFLRQAIKNDDIIGVVQHSKQFFLMSVVVESYLSHFNPAWLFMNSGNEPHKVPGFGLLHHWTAPFIVIGIISFFTTRFPRKTKQLIFLWLLTAPVAGAITTDAPHALRSYTMLPMWEIFTGLGIMRAYGSVKNVIGKKLFVISISCITILSITFFYINYFTILPKVQSGSFQFPASEVMKFVLHQEKSYTKIIFSNQEQLYQSYMYFLFYSRYHPSAYLKEGGTKSGGFAQIHTIGKYEFRPINWDREDKEKNILYIGRVKDFENYLNSLRMQRQFSGLDGTPEILVVTAN